MLDIKPGETWIRRDGGKAITYAVDGGGDHPIHGAVEQRDGSIICSWTKNGSFIDEDYGHQYDLIRKYDWREELAPIWAVLQPTYKAVAEVQPNIWYAYTTAEQRFANISAYIRLQGLVLPVPDCDWTETWTVRPE